VEQAAAQGFVKAHLSLGVVYYQGRGVDRDYARAIKFYLKAAAQVGDDKKARNSSTVTV